MSGGYSKSEIIQNIRNLRTLNELDDIAYADEKQVHGYARKEAQAEIKRRLLNRRIKNKVKKTSFGNINKTLSWDDLMRL